MGQTDSSYLSTVNCGIPDPLDYYYITPNTNLLLNLIISTQIPVPTYLYNGLASGSVFPLGPTANTYYASIAPGDSSFCSFNVTVTNPATINMSGVPTNICADEGLYLLTGATPAGGNYFGTNITANNFDTDTASLGLNTINYTYTDVNGCNDSASKNVNVNSCVGIEQNDAFGFNVYPNPASCFININISGATQVNINVNDLSGRMIISKLLTGGINSLSLAELESGIYLVILSDKETGKQITKKIIKQ